MAFFLAVPNVSPANTGPSIAKHANATPNPITGASAILNVLGQDDLGEQSLTYTWETIGNWPAPVNFTANGTNQGKNCLAKFTAPGVYKFQVTVRDPDNLTVTDSVTVTVQQNFLVWSAGMFSAAELADPLISGPLANPSNDGVNNLLKYGLGLNPNLRDGIRGLPMPSLQNGCLALTLVRPHPARPDITYVAEANSDQSSGPWLSLSFGAPVNNGNGTETLTAEDLMPVSSTPSRFMHLRVVKTGDPLAGIPFYLRMQTHAIGSTAVVGLYADTACTVAITDAQATTGGVKVAAWRDDLGTGSIVFSQSDPSKQPTVYRLANGNPVLRFSGSPCLLQWGSAASPLSVSLDNVTKFVRASVTPHASTYGQGTVIVAGASGTTGSNEWMSAGSFQVGAMDNGFKGGTALLGGAIQQCRHASMVTEANVCTATTFANYVDGITLLSGTGASGTLNNGVMQYCTIGARSVFGSYADYATGDVEAILFAPVISDADRNVVFSALGGTNNPVIACVGDSMTAGYNYESGLKYGQAYPDMMCALRSTATIINEGRAGDTIIPFNGYGIGLRSSATDALLRNGAGTLVVLIGTNDLSYQIGNTPASIAAAIWNYCDARRSAGWTVYVCTILPRAQAGLYSGFESDRETLNGLIRLNYGSHATGLIDVGAQGNGIGWDGTGTNPATQTTYYNADATHLNAAGNTVLAGFINASLP